MNTTDSRVTLLWDLEGSVVLPPLLKARAVERLGDRLVDGVVAVTASDERSQLRNRELALRRLADLIASAIAPPPPHRRPTRPSRGSIARRLDTKKKRASIKSSRRPPSTERD